MAARTSFSASLLISLLLVLLRCHSLGVSTANAASKMGRFDSIYQFGDSISDTGNLMKENPSSFCSYRPYGETFFGKPTGRCSNGLLIVDYFARAFNLPPLNPYLQSDADFSHGVNFAVAGATALNSSSHLAAPTNSSLPVQLGWFRTHLLSACSSSYDCKKDFEKTLFIMGEVGSNDYGYTFLTNVNMGEAAKLVPDVVQTIVNAVKEVIEHGAIEVMVPGNFPLGCIPIYRDHFGSHEYTEYDNFGCLKRFNKFARFHNDYLIQAIQELRKEYPGVAIHYGDYYSAFTWVLENASSLGFEKDGLLSPCCGDAEHPCGSSEVVMLCPDPTKRISWDGTHLTQEAYKNMAELLLSNLFLDTLPPHLSSPAPSPNCSEVSGAQLISVVLCRVIMVSVIALWAIGSKLL